MRVGILIVTLLVIVGCEKKGSATKGARARSPHRISHQLDR